MSGSTDGIRAGDLLQEIAFVRRLARRLVRGPADAEDLEQDVLLLAWERRPASAHGVRPWLAAVARRLAFHRVRSEGRRTVRERVARAPADAADPRAVAEHFELVRAVIEEVHRLEEPYRTTLLCVYLEQQTPREIANALALPAATVRSHLKRGLDELRLRLDARDPERPGRWREDALAWLAVGRKSAAPKLVAYAASALLGVGISGALVASGGAMGSSAEGTAHRDSTMRGELASPAVAAVAAARERERDLPPPLVVPTNERAPERLRGRLLGLDRAHPFTAPIVAHPVESLAPSVAAAVAPDGTFALDLAPLHAPGEELLACAVVADDPDYVVASETVLLDDGRGFGPFPELGGERRLNVTLAAVASGRVVDEAGLPLAHMDLVATRVGAPAVSWSEMPGEAFTDADGRFRIRSSFDGEHRLVVASRPSASAPLDASWRGRRRLERRVDFARGEALELGTLVSEAGRCVAGRVVRTDGSAVEGARVAAFPLDEGREPTLAETIACSNGDGAFVLGGLGVGRFRVDVEGLGGARACDRLVEPVIVTNDACARPLRLVLADRPPMPSGFVAPASAPECGTVRLHFIDAHGERVARVHVALFPAGRSTPPRACVLPVAGDATAELTSVPAGAWTIDARPGADRNGLHGLFLHESREVTVVANAVTELDLPLHAGARLGLRVDSGEATARLFTAEGSAVDVGWFAASGPELLLPVEGPRADRDVVADRALAPGRYRIALALGDAPPRERWIDLAPGSTHLESFERELR